METDRARPRAPARPGPHCGIDVHRLEGWSRFSRRHILPLKQMTLYSGVTRLARRFVDNRTGREGTPTKRKSHSPYPAHADSVTASDTALSTPYRSDRATAETFADHGFTANERVIMCWPSHESRFSNKLRQGAIPSFHIGTCVRFDPVVVAKWLRMQ